MVQKMSALSRASRQAAGQSGTRANDGAVLYPSAVPSLKQRRCIRRHKSALSSYKKQARGQLCVAASRANAAEGSRIVEDTRRTRRDAFLSEASYLEELLQLLARSTSLEQKVRQSHSLRYTRAPTAWSFHALEHLLNR